MSEPSHNLSNSFLAVRLLALREFPPEAGQGSGPFLVVQHGIDPDDAEMEPADFVLTLQGSWIRVEHYLQLSSDDRFERACFPSAAAVIALLEQLPPRPTVERRVASADGSDPPPAEPASHGDPSDSALLRAIRGDVTPSPRGSGELPPP